MARKGLAVALVAAVLIGLYASGIFEAANLATFRARHAEFAREVAAAPLAAGAAFFSLYVVTTALSLPFAALLTLAAGALFGLALGTLIVSFASTLGATIAFLLARHVLRDAVAGRFGDWLARFDRGIARDGAFFLFTVRLVPIVPFLVINLVAGLSAMRARTFAIVSQIGMLPATIVYVNAGTKLSEIESLRDILAWPVLGAFAALAVLPWIGRAIVGGLSRARIYRGFRRPARFERDLVVIGAGAAGLVAAYVGAAVRAKVTLVEAREMGGDCLNTGCVPSKALIRAARAAEDVRQAEAFGILASPPRVDFPAVMARVRAVIADIAPHDSVARYTALGVDVRHAHARIVDPWRVALTAQDGSETQLTTRAIVIAAGAAPIVPDIPGLDEAGFVTSETLWDALERRDALPERIAILGGGAIGCELAQALQRLGAAVTLVEAMDHLLAREEPEASALLASALGREGVAVLTGNRAIRVEPAGEARRLILANADGESEITCDMLIVAVGRKARLSGYGLEELGIPVDRVVETNAFLETRFPNILAAGDVAGPYQLTHAAGHQGWHAAINGLLAPFWRFRVDYRYLPATVFTDPEIARVGVSAAEGAASGKGAEITHLMLADLDRAIAEGAKEGFIKVITARGSDKILGVTIAGARAGEMIAEFTLAMKHGIGLKKLLATIHAYPTFTEINKAAAGEWRRSHASARMLGLVERYFAWRRG
jgi:pyruvate/2-oxoglutarate dehydrogenase complex dihydrolipoamide dehydrogenase (E3) component/uncharacterized membrane protein YdjX (TVP38/TMEM64 family)